MQGAIERGMPTKRSFADFQDSCEIRFQQAPSLPLSPSSLQFSTPLASASRHDVPPSPKHIQDLATTWYETRAADTNFPFLRRRASLPTLRQLRTLCPTLLTSKNLQAMDPTHLPMTPDRTMSGKSRSSTTTITIADDGRKMSLVGLLDCAAGKVRLDQRPSLRDTVQQIVGGSRASCMKPESAQAFSKTLSKVQRRNEPTIAERMMPFLVKRERTVPADEEDDEGSILSGKEIDRSTLRSFELDHLDWSIDKDFVRASVPFPATETRNPSDFGIKNPKPDIAYGFEPYAFDTQQQKALLTFEPELSGGIISPFFVIQWKGFAGSMQTAKDQARRDGAAMVYSRRKAMARIPLTSESHNYLDLASMAFTCVINTEAAHLHIHWAEEAEGKIDWLMAVVKRYHLEEDDNIRDLRRALHNILDWGLSDRLALVKSQVDLYQEQAAPAYGHGHIGGAAKRRRVEEIDSVV
ncbi:hypothetical protein V491_01999 [Pseudogymnoascus sp. VKM F-3775]|nr:hypothetical protein V491_01999 [Pseudogymnoascus sp. VKM F-3775]